MGSDLKKRFRVKIERFRHRIQIAHYNLARNKNSYNKDIFKDLENFCLFLGYPRSGHSLVGSLIDAHPNAIVAHELDILDYVDLGASAIHMNYLLLENAQKFSRNGRKWTGYSYEVPNQWQGRFSKLRLIGDKKGGGSAIRLRRKPELLKKLHDKIGINLKIIHVIRNPFDNITTISKRQNYSLGKSIDFYFSMCETISDLKKNATFYDILDLRQEELINSPKEILAKICRFLELEETRDYINDCSSIVYKKSHKSRFETPWNSKSIDAVDRRMKEFEFLNDYSYEM